MSTKLSLRWVVDSNTVLALWMFKDPALAKLRGFIATGQTTLLVNTQTLTELQHTLTYRQFALSLAQQQEIYNNYHLRSELIDAQPSGNLPNCKDRDDQKFLELTAAGQASLLLTRDKALLKLAKHRLIRDRFTILSPEAWQKSPPL